MLGLCSSFLYSEKQALLVFIAIAVAPVNSASVSSGSPSVGEGGTVFVHTTLGCAL